MASARLTPREIEVCTLLATGITNRQIAEALYISENTVEFHLGNIFNKFQVHTRTEAAMLFLQMQPDSTP